MLPAPHLVLTEYTAFLMLCKLVIRRTKQTLMHDDRLADYDLPSEAIDVECSGSEGSFSSCFIELLNNTNCTDVPYLRCSKCTTTTQNSKQVTC